MHKYDNNQLLTGNIIPNLATISSGTCNVSMGLLQDA